MAGYKRKTKDRRKGRSRAQVWANSRFVLLGQLKWAESHIKAMAREKEARLLLNPGESYQLLYAAELLSQLQAKVRKPKTYEEFKRETGKEVR